jgi:ABC-2 type transport system ATP-binding protein
MGFIKPQSGTAIVGGVDCWKNPAEIMKRVGYIPGEIAFPDEATGTSFLKRQADLLGLRDMTYADYITQKLQLDPTANLKRMSKGTRKSLRVCSNARATTIAYR